MTSASLATWIVSPWDSAWRLLSPSQVSLDTWMDCCRTDKDTRSTLNGNLVDGGVYYYRLPTAQQGCPSLLTLRPLSCAAKCHLKPLEPGMVSIRSLPHKMGPMRVDQFAARCWYPHYSLEQRRWGTSPLRSWLATINLVVPLVAPTHHLKPAAWWWARNWHFEKYKRRQEWDHG